MAARRATVPAFAKLNLSLLVLGKRADGYHELRTVFQTISLADKVSLAWTPGRTFRIEARPEIPNNLAVRAAEAIQAETGIRGRLEIGITKEIPMGGGLGGGSSNAAAVLLALPVLAGVRLAEETLQRLAVSIGSDVPFFLTGGTALGLGRGEELYPLPTPAEGHVVVVTPGLSVSTPEAFRGLARGPLDGLTFTELSNKIKSLRAMIESLGVSSGAGRKTGWRRLAENDFERVVFARYPELGQIRERLSQLGAEPARMSGSGSTLFGVFPNRRGQERALRGVALVGGANEGSAGGLNTGMARLAKSSAVRFLDAKAYRSAWGRALGEHKVGNLWPLQSRYASSK